MGVPKPRQGRRTGRSARHRTVTTPAPHRRTFVCARQGQSEATAGNRIRSEMWSQAPARFRATGSPGRLATILVGAQPCGDRCLMRSGPFPGEMASCRWTLRRIKNPRSCTVSSTAAGNINRRRSNPASAARRAMSCGNRMHQLRSVLQRLRCRRLEAGLFWSAALNRAWTLVNDERHVKVRDVLDIVMTSGGCTNCHTHGNCTEQCPVGISPTAAIAGLKRRSLLRWLRKERR